MFIAILKPENIFIAQPRRVDVSFTAKVLDFGIAKWVQEIQSSGKNSQIIGSPLWMAPEQLEPGTIIGPATDVWALGLIFFYVFTGKSYWVAANAESSSVTAVLLEVAVHPMPPPSERAAELGCREGCIPPGFDEWFARACARAAGSRFQDGEEAMASLVAVLGAVTVPGVERNTPILHTIAAPRSDIKSVSGDLASALAGIGGGDTDDAEMALRLAKVFELSDAEHERAVEAYQRVLSLQPESADALRGLASLYRKHERWTELCATLSALAELPTTDAEEAVRCLAEVATIRDDELGDARGAEDTLARAVELSPSSPATHEAYAHFLVRAGRTEEAVAGLIEAAEAGALEAPARGPLLMRAAELAQAVPELAEQAVRALEAAVALTPDAVEPRARLAAVRAERGDDPDSAMDGWRRVLRADLKHSRAWEELFALHRDRGELDAAWCVADTAIGVLGEDNVDEPTRDFHTEHYFEATSTRPERLDEEAFWRLAHPDLLPQVSRSFAVLVPSLSAACPTPEESGLSVAELVDPSTSSRKLLRAAMPLYRVLLPAGACLDVPSMPSLYFREGEPIGLRHVASRPPASVAGETTQSSWGEAELGYLCASHMAFYRPELHARVLLATPEEREATWGRIVSGEGLDPEMTRRMARVSPDAPGAVELDRWVHGAESHREPRGAPLRPRPRSRPPGVDRGGRPAGRPERIGAPARPGPLRDLAPVLRAPRPPSGRARHGMSGRPDNTLHRGSDGGPWCPHPVDPFVRPLHRHCSATMLPQPVISSPPAHEGP